ncbi:hypothetical protein [Thermaerobacter litoralis]
MTAVHPGPGSGPAPDERGRQAAREALAAGREAVQPPGGFDAWLHLLAVPVYGPGDGAGTEPAPAGEGPAAPPGASSPQGPAASSPSPGAVAAGPVCLATASLTAPNDPSNPLSLFFIPPARVEATLERLLAQLAGTGAGGPAPGGGAGAGGDDVARWERLPGTGTASLPEGRGGGRPHDLAAPPGLAAPSGWLLQVGASGMQFRALAEPPAGFVPRYRLPRRTGAEPVWAPDEPLWCPHGRLVSGRAAVARQLAEELGRRLA